MNNDRKQLIKLAASLPKGDEKRRVLLAELQKTSARGSLAASMTNWFMHVSDDMLKIHGRKGSKMKVRNLSHDGFFFTLGLWMDSARNYWENVEGQLRLTKRGFIRLEFGNVKRVWDLTVSPSEILSEWRELNSYDFDRRMADSNKEAKFNWDGRLEGPKARASWVRRGRYPYMLIEELPGKPFKRKLRKAVFRWTSYQQWPLLMENVLDDARLSKNMSYDKMVQSMQHAISKIPGKYDEKTIERNGKMPESVKKDLARQPYEETVFYLNVEPVNYEPISFSGKGFHGTSEWTKFVFYEDSDRDDYMAQMEGMRAKNESKSAGGARKLFKILKANPDLTRNMSKKDFVQMLAKNKIAYDYWPTVWR